MTDPQPSLFDRPAPYQRGSDTSQEAAAALYDRLPRLRRAVLAAFEAAGDAGLTADEAAAVVGITAFACRPRVTELMHAGLIEKTTERRENASGMSARVLRRKA